MNRRLSSFQTLALWTTATTYFLILVGGLVRASGAGLGCPDWPRCFGSWIPPASAAELPAGFDPSQFNPTLMWTEYLNRLLGVTVGLLIFATLVSAWRHHRRTPHIVWPTTAAFLLVGFQGWLGGVVVQQELAAWLVTVHMLIALVIVSLLLYPTVYAFFAEGAAIPADSAARRPLAWSAGALIVVTLIQITLGTQVREHIDMAMGEGVARANALGTVGNYDRWHRDVALAVIAGTIAVLWQITTRSRHEIALVRTAVTMAALVGVQVALGGTMAYLMLTPPAQVMHLTGSSLLLGAETVLLLLALWLPAGNEERRTKNEERKNKDQKEAGT
jgi:cytochrome c oxidase assembly protein subunit 15